MAISTRKAFEEKSQKELSEEVLGISIDPFMNARLAWKQFWLSIMLFFFVTKPFIDTYTEQYICLKSIEEI